MKNPAKIFIADDHGITRLGLNFLCSEVFPSAKIVEFDTIGNLYQALRTEKPNLLILDLFINEHNSLNNVSEIVQLQPGIQILVISMASENTYGERVLRSGARGFINKLCSNEELKSAIETVAGGDFYISRDMYLNHLKNMGKPAEPNPFSRLSNKEIEMAHYLTEGFSTSEIAEKTRLALSTVSTYKMRIYSKLGIDNLADLLNLANSFNLKGIKDEQI